jgi:transcriptional regulator with XRE-family HTH domain
MVQPRNNGTASQEEKPSASAADGVGWKAATDLFKEWTAGMSVREIAAQTGVSVGAIQNLRAGISVSRDTLLRLAEGLGRNPNQLFRLVGMELSDHFPDPDSPETTKGGFVARPGDVIPIEAPGIPRGAQVRLTEPLLRMIWCYHETQKRAAEDGTP